MMLAAVALLVAMLLPNTGRAQDAPAAGCTLAIEGSGSSSVFINASGCTGDTIAIIAAAGGKQQQFPPMPGPEIYQPWNIQPCDLGLDTDQPVPLSYTAVVVSGPDKGKTSAPYTGTLEPSRPPDDAPPSISFSGTPTTGTFVRTGDTIALTVTAEDDAGLTSLKVTDPNGQVILDKRIAPVHTAQNKCHSHPEGQRETVTLPKIVVPQDPPTPVIRFTAVARDTAGQETTAVAEYLTEAVWTGRMNIRTTGDCHFQACTTTWHIDLSVKTTQQDEVSGTGLATHAPKLGCQYVSGPDPGGETSAEIGGTYDGKSFRLNVAVKGGNVVAYAVSGAALLQWPSPQTVELTGNRDHVSGNINLTGKGNVGGTCTASIEGQADLRCCSSDSDSAPPLKVPPVFLGDQK